MVTIIKEAHTEYSEEMNLEYRYRNDPDVGFAFPWKDGKVQLNPLSEKITSGAKIIRKRLSAWELLRGKVHAGCRLWQDASAVRNFTLTDTITDVLSVRDV